MKVTNYKQLVVWQKSVDLVTRIYQLTKTFPKDEVYGLTAQLRRAAISVPSNIAEGQGRNSTGEFVHFLGIARGSLKEIETQLIIATNLRYTTESRLELVLKLMAEIAKMINKLIANLSTTTH